MLQKRFLQEAELQHRCAGDHTVRLIGIGLGPCPPSAKGAASIWRASAPRGGPEGKKEGPEAKYTVVPSLQKKSAAEILLEAMENGETGAARRGAARHTLEL